MQTPLQSPQQGSRTTPRTRRNAPVWTPIVFPYASSSLSRGAIRSRADLTDRHGMPRSFGIESDFISRDAHPDSSPDVGLKQWTTNHLEWSYEGISSLSDNSANTPVSERSALLGKVIANTRFRIDVVFNSRQPAQADWQADLGERLGVREDVDRSASESNKEDEPHFWVYIATLDDGQEYYRNMVDLLPRDANIFLGIKPRNEVTGKRHGYSDWIWQTSTTHVFTDDRTFCEFQLPSLPVLLENTRIREQDAFTLVLRLQTPATFEASDFDETGKQTVDRDLMLGLRSLLDDGNTGDVKFVCLEKQVVPSSSDTSLEGETSTSNRYRKRTLFAHSGILKHRSEYLADCIKFSSDRERDPIGERHATSASDRKVQTIRCLDVDYVTMYWLLHYVYTGEVDFKDEQDFGDSTDLQIYKINPGFAKRLDTGRRDEDEWEWSEADPFQASPLGSHDEEDDSATVTSASAGHSSVSTSPHQQAKSYGAIAAQSKGAKSIQTPSEKSAGFPSTGSTSRPVWPSILSGSATTQNQASMGKNSSSPTAPLQQHSMRSLPVPDPHKHPGTPAPPASAFATYALAHRYQLDDLARLAQDHLLGCLTPHSASSLLMASFRFYALHCLVEDYVISNWAAVQESPMFLRTIQEVASGSWGSEGGSCLHGLFGRLHGGFPPTM